MTDDDDLPVLTHILRTGSVRPVGEQPTPHAATAGQQEEDLMADQLVIGNEPDLLTPPMPPMPPMRPYLDAVGSDALDPRVGIASFDPRERTAVVGHESESAERVRSIDELAVAATAPAPIDAQAMAPPDHAATLDESTSSEQRVEPATTTDALDVPRMAAVEFGDVVEDVGPIGPASLEVPTIAGVEAETAFEDARSVDPAASDLPPMASVEADEAIEETVPVEPVAFAAPVADESDASPSRAIETPLVGPAAEDPPIDATESIQHEPAAATETRAASDDAHEPGGEAAAVNAAADPLPTPTHSISAEPIAAPVPVTGPTPLTEIDFAALATDVHESVLGDLLSRIDTEFDARIAQAMHAELETALAALQASLRERMTEAMNDVVTRAVHDEMARFAVVLGDRPSG